MDKPRRRAPETVTGTVTVTGTGSRALVAGREELAQLVELPLAFAALCSLVFRLSNFLTFSFARLPSLCFASSLLHSNSEFEFEFAFKFELFELSHFHLFNFHFQPPASSLKLQAPNTKLQAPSLSSSSRSRSGALPVRLWPLEAPAAHCVCSATSFRPLAIGRPLSLGRAALPSSLAARRLSPVRPSGPSGGQKRAEASRRMRPQRRNWTPLVQFGAALWPLSRALMTHKRHQWATMVLFSLGAPNWATLSLFKLQSSLACWLVGWLAS